VFQCPHDPLSLLCAVPRIPATLPSAITVKLLMAGSLEEALRQLNPINC
jgi:hypothetical protein